MHKIEKRNEDIILIIIDYIDSFSKKDCFDRQTKG